MKREFRTRYNKNRRIYELYHVMTDKVIKVGTESQMRQAYKKYNHMEITKDIRGKLYNRLYEELLKVDEIENILDDILKIVEIGD